MRSGGASALVIAVCLGAAGCGGDDAAGPASPTPPAASTSTAPAADTGAVERPPGFPNGGERAMLARLDPGVARLCTRTGPAGRSASAVAGITCRTAAGYGASARYELFSSRAAMADAYGAIRAANGVPVASGRCVPAGGGGRVPGDAPWGFGRGRDEGRVQCYRSREGVRFVTSLDRINVIAIATAPRFGAVDRFWRTVGLPDVALAPGA